MYFNKILVPIDFSENSNVAVNYATELALNFHADLTLYHAIVMFQYDFSDEKKVDQYESILKNHAQEVRNNLSKSGKDISDLGITVDTVVERNISAADAILNFLDKNDFDLVVMGTRGKTGLKHLLQGSVAEKIVRLAPIPTLTVHDQYKAFKLEHLLVPIDFSEASTRALKHAYELQQKLKTVKITCLHVVEKMVYPAYYAGGIDSIFELDSDLRERIIHNMKELAQKTGIRENIDYAVAEGIAHQEIVSFARKADIDLIAISTRGLTGFEYALIGSTAEKVVRLASVPVLTFK